MSEYIIDEDMIKQLLEIRGTAYGYELVRCRDCVFWGTKVVFLDENKKEAYGSCLNFDVGTPRDFYCKWGEKKDAEVHS